MAMRTSQLYAKFQKSSLLALSAPLVRSYGLAYISTTAPRLLNLLFMIAKKKQDRQQILITIYTVLKGSLALHRFPTFCAALVGGYSFSQRPIRAVYHYACVFLISHNGKRWAAQGLEIAVSRFLSAFFSAWLSLQLLNSPKRAPNTKERAIDLSAPSNIISVPNPSKFDHDKPSSDPTHQSGKTIDLTLFAATRALEALVVNLWRHNIATSPKPPSKFATVLSHHTDSLLFALSSGTIMWSWFYHPQNLPRAYNKWIASAAQVDSRLIEVLRLARQGKFVYNKDMGPEARLLEGMCKEYSWPMIWGDPQKIVPIPCEMVHMGTGPNCHWHAAVRFTRAFKFAMATNLPLQILAKLFSKRRITPKVLARIVKDSARSSAFLGAFVALMYYGICLSRTQLGPRLFTEKQVSRQEWDSGLCVGAACVLCGWSSLIEAQKRRGELAMFVAPRAAATIMPREYDRKYFWRERAAFSVSMALLFTLAQEDPGRVRGVMGRLLNSVLAA